MIDDEEKKKNQDQEEKSWTRNTKEGTRTKRARIEHLHQYTGYARTTIIPLLARKAWTKSFSRKERIMRRSTLSTKKTKNDPSTLKPEFFFPLFSYFLIESKRRCTLLPGNRTRMQTAGLKKKCVYDVRARTRVWCVCAREHV